MLVRRCNADVNNNNIQESLLSETVVAADVAVVVEVAVNVVSSLLGIF